MVMEFELLILVVSSLYIVFKLISREIQRRIIMGASGWHPGPQKASSDRKDASLRCIVFRYGGVTRVQLGGVPFIREEVKADEDLV